MLLVPLLRLWKIDLRIPFNYAVADANAHQLLLKTTVDHGWYEHNPDVGAPMGLTLHAFPMPDNLHLAVTRVLALVVGDSGMIYNLYYLAGYPLAAMAAAWAFRRIGLGVVTSVGMAILYALLPYHFGRGGNGHLFLAAYFVVPPAAWLLVEIAGGRPIHAVRDGPRWRRFLTGRTALTVTICAVLASASGYYAIFAMVLAAGAATLAAFSGRARHGVPAALLMIGLLLGVQALHLAPDLLYRAAHPEVAQVGYRNPGETEHLALKLSQLILPIAGHRIDALSEIRREYDQSFPLPSEGNQIPMGLVASVGLAILIAALFASVMGRPPADERHRALAGLAGVAFLVSTVGGLSSLVALLAITQVRGWNRVVVYLAFFALAAVGLALDRAGRSAWLRSHGRLPFHAVAVLVVAVGVADQTSEEFVPNYLRARFEFQNDADFVDRVEAALPERAAVFQLPFVPYPEEPPVHRMIDYDHFRGYLHSEDLRWSYGAIKGTDRWQRALVSRPTSEMVLAVAAVGFDAVWVDRYGYGDSGAAVEEELRTATRDAPLVSRNGRFSLFRIGHIRSAMSASQAAALRNAVLDPVRAGSGRGMHEPEQSEGRELRWLSSEATLVIENPGPESRTVVVGMTLRAPVPGRWLVEVTWPDGHRELVSIAAEETNLERTIVVAEGTALIRFATDAPAVLAPADDRALHLQLFDLRVDDLQALLAEVRE